MKRDYASLVVETIVALRGEFSQEQINRKLKFKSNQVARWESGHARMTWHSFCDYCRVLRRPLEKSAKAHLFFEKNIADQKTFVRELSHFYTQKHLAKALDVSPSLISRYLAGRTEITVDAIFHLIDLSPYSLPEFVAALTFPRVPPSIASEQERIQKEKVFHFANPWVAALILYLKTKEYKSLKKHSDLYLAKKVGVSETELRNALQELQNFGAIEKSGSLYRTTTDHLSTGGSFEGAVNIRRYWQQRCLDYVIASKPGKTVYSGYKVYNIAENQKPKFEDFFFRMNAELDQLIKQQGGISDSVHLFLFQMFDVADLNLKSNESADSATIR